MTYDELLAERDHLRCLLEQAYDRLAAAQRKAEENWNVVESVACGETIECHDCGKRKPCLCDK